LVRILFFYNLHLLSFRHQIGFHVYIVNKLQQIDLKLLRVQDLVQDLKVILQPFFF